MTAGLRYEYLPAENAEDRIGCHLARRSCTAWIGRRGPTWSMTGTSDARSGMQAPKGTLDPEMMAALRKADELRDSPRNPLAAPSAASRASFERLCEYWNSGGPAAAAADHEIAGPSRPIPVRFIYPKAGDDLPVVLYLHGGGWCTGSVAANERRMRLLAVESGAVVAGVGYALAPENPYPTAIREVLAVIAWIATQGRTVGVDPTRIGIAGISAGANLALATCLKLGDDGSRLIRAAALFVGLYGADLETPSYREFDGTGYGPSRRQVRALFDWYAPHSAVQRDPYIVPLLADLTDLPDLYLCAAGADTLRDDSVTLTKRIAEAGGYAELEMIEGVTHDFTIYQSMVGKARQAVRSGAAFLAERL